MNLVVRWSVAAKDDSIDARLIERVLGEYREMPGLALTIEQARVRIRELPCCTTRADGAGDGDPINLALVGSGEIRAEEAGGGA